MLSTPFLFFAWVEGLRANPGPPGIPPQGILRPFSDVKVTLYRIFVHIRATVYRPFTGLFRLSRTCLQLCRRSNFSPCRYDPDCHTTRGEKNGRTEETERRKSRGGRDAGRKRRQRRQEGSRSYYRKNDCHVPYIMKQRKNRLPCAVSVLFLYVNLSGCSGTVSGFIYPVFHIPRVDSFRRTEQKNFLLSVSKNCTVV